MTETQWTCGCHPEIIEANPGVCPKCGMGLEEVLPVVSGGVHVWTCPMHPEIEQSAYGMCPKCGMALELKQGAQQAEDSSKNPELRDMTRRFWFSVVFVVPLLVVSMGDMLPGQPISSVLSPGVKALLELLLASPIVLWAAWPFYVRAVNSLRTKNLNMFTLIGLGVFVAYGYSVVAVLFPGLFPDSFRHGGQVAVYFEAAGVIVTLVLVGQVMELKARGQTSQAIRYLLNMQPTIARRIDAQGNDEDVPLEAVQQWDLLRVRPGDKVPVDGSVVEGSSAVDESLVTGEPMPVTKQSGDPLIGGTLNTTGSFVMRAEKIGADTLLSRIVHLVAEAQRTRAPIQKLADRVAGYFVPTVMGIALLTFAAWAFFGPEPRMTFAIISAVAVLIVACPCALGLATPMSIMVATGRGAREGVLFRNAEAIETLGKVDTLIIDKTGTLTEGKPKVTSVQSLEAWSEDQLLELSASLEQSSEHPLGQSLVNEAGERKLKLERAVEFNSVPGKGVRGTVQGKNIVVGNAAMMQDSGIDFENYKDQTEGLSRRGHTVVYVGIDGTLGGFLGISDPIKPSTPDAIRALHKEGLRIVMLTGDNPVTAEGVAQELGIDEVIAGVLPDQKAEHVRSLKGNLIAMAGDGVNDAPVLAAAHVGIAMGTGSDVAIEAADVTLVKGDLLALVRARRLSRETMSNIKQNLWFAFGYNALSVPVAAGILYPFIGVLLSPMLAALAMSFSSVSVITNALRLGRR